MAAGEGQITSIIYTVVVYRLVVVTVYSGAPLMRPLLGNANNGRMRAVAAGEGDRFIKILFSKILDA